MRRALTGPAPPRRAVPRHKEGRRMTRWEPEHLREKRHQRVEANPALMKRRQQMVEPPCGPTKPWHNQGYFLMQGLAKVRAEFSLSPLASNLRRVVTVVEVP